MQARATHICLDCGYIYFLPKSFDDQVSPSHITYIKSLPKNNCQETLSFFIYIAPTLHIESV